MNFQQARLLILGDIMLDQYWFGKTARISPEAPVPVVQVDHIDERPGGAANVALGVSALGATPHLMGLVGEDQAADRLENLLKNASVNYCLERIRSYHTITKLRIMSRNQQMIRLDTEKPFLHETENHVLLRQKFIQNIEKTDVLILSDYGKGTLKDIQFFIKEAREKKIPIVVDPKSRDFSIYQGASVLTPNLKEFEAVVGPCLNEKELVSKAQAALDNYNLQALVITRSEQGLSVITNTGQVHHIPAVAREVHDVTGAGDTVIAVLATALAIKMDLLSAAALGNIAAGISVGKLGAAAVTLNELKHSFINQNESSYGVLTEEKLLAELQLSKAKGETIVFTNGCFDILHAGHVLYLEQAKQLGDRVIVAVNTDESVKRLKGATRPINSVEDRMRVLAGLKSVDWVVPFSEDTPERLIQALAPHVLVKGGDYKDIHALPGARFVLASGGKVKLLGLKEGCSTTNIIEKISFENVY